MTLNPLELLDRLLVDYASPKARRTVHTVIMLALTLVAAWMAVGGNLTEFLTSLAVLAYAGANRANTDPVDPGSYEDTPGYTDEVSGNDTGYIDGH